MFERAATCMKLTSILPEAMTHVSPSTITTMMEKDLSTVAILTASKSCGR